MRDFVGEEPEPLVGGDVDPEQDAIAPIAGAQRGIRCARLAAALEIGGRLEEDERDFEAEVVAQVSADAFVGALRLARDALGVQIERRSVVRSRNDRSGGRAGSAASACAGVCAVADEAADSTITAAARATPVPSTTNPPRPDGSSSSGPR